MEPAVRIAILHLTGDIPDGDALSLGQRVRAYWGRHILPGIARLENVVPGPERERRMAEAEAARDAVLDIVHEYDLDRRLAASQRSRRTMEAR